MTRNIRTDVHAPKNLVTEDYEFVGCGDFGGADGEPAYIDPTIRAATADGKKFGENYSAGSCYHCGARIRYYAVMEYLPTGELIRVGETCLDNRFERATGEFHAMRKRAELDRAAQRIKTIRLRWFAIDPDREVAFGFAADHPSEFCHKFAQKVRNYGSTSDRYVAAIMRTMARDLLAEDVAPEPTAPVVEGRIVITGEVLSEKWQTSDYGEQHKMLVRDDRGFKVWGSVPAAIEMSRFHDADGMYQEIPGVEKGSRVTFTATVEASRDDESFGFFMRPSKAELLEVAVVA